VENDVERALITIESCDWQELFREPYCKTPQERIELLGSLLRQTQNWPENSRNQLILKIQEKYHLDFGIPASV
jgi:hypothetical protein